MKASRQTVFRTSGLSAVDRVMKDVGVKTCEALMPLTGAQHFVRSVRGINGKEIEAKPMQYIYRLRLTDGTDAFKAAERLAALPEVEFAEPNYLVYSLAASNEPDDPYYSLQYGIQDINLFALWGQPIINKDGPIIAILDTGVDVDHPDLVANIWRNPAENGGAKGYDDDGNGYVDDLNGWDFVNDTGAVFDYNGHGTHCAGIAAATGWNGVGVIGANPSARIMPLTVLQSNGTGDVATIIRALDYAAAAGADIISMSLGTYAESAALEQALGRAYQKSVIVAAAGNDGQCLNHAHREKGQMEPMPMFPAAYTFVLGVQASGVGDGLESFSNYDDNGPIYSDYDEEKLYNYELTAPGASVVSTFPNGKYKQLNGTSMAAPLVAGAISRLLQCKEYTSKEDLFGDLINSVTSKGNLDIYAAYCIKDSDRHPRLQLLGCETLDPAGDGDGRADAGETIEIYPILRNTWGNARNIKLRIESAEEVNTLVTFIDRTADFGSDLSSYGKARAATPLRVHFADNAVDGRIVRLRIIATADNAAPVSQEIQYTLENGVDLSGIIDKDMTLYNSKTYDVTGNVAVPNGITLTIEPGTTLKFDKSASIKVDGMIMAVGTPEKPIKFLPRENRHVTSSYILMSNNKNPSVLRYCHFYGFTPLNIVPLNDSSLKLSISDCLFDYVSKPMDSNLLGSDKAAILERCVIGLEPESWSNADLKAVSAHCNYFTRALPEYNDLYPTTNPPAFVLWSSEKWGGNNFLIPIRDDWSSKIKNITFTDPNYFGSGVERIARKNIWDIEAGHGFAKYDLSNMLTRPHAEAHGVVWKVTVNGFDSQDEFESLPPLGVGRHKFEVYFNRRMNHSATPTVAMGVRPPYTQTAIAERGSWRSETMIDGNVVDIYTAYLTISGRSSYDGLNRIYVAGAQDDEYFDIPVECSRFNVEVQAAGSLSEGFTAKPGLGRVELRWDNSEDSFDDMLGYNMYRYRITDETGTPSDTVRINERLLEADQTELTDYDVTPGTTYCYYYKVMRTNMTENSPSKTVAVTPQTSTAGDANGSGEVDVADVITTVNYAAGMNPRPFIFEAADINSDAEIDILDVVGIIRHILSPGTERGVSVEAVASYSIEEDTLYIDCPVAVAGVQLNIDGEPSASPVEACAALDGFEKAGAWIAENEYVFMAYTLSGRRIVPGRHALAVINGVAIKSIKLSDADGANITALYAHDTTGLENVAVMCPRLTGIYTLQGVKVADSHEALDRLPRGIYIVDGVKTVK